MFFSKSNDINYFYYSLDRMVDFYFEMFFLSLSKNNQNVERNTNDIKQLIYTELDCYEFKLGRQFVKKDKNLLGIKKLSSEIGHLTGVWNFDWAWITHHIVSDYTNVKKALNIVEESKSKNILVYKYVPSNYYDFAESIYLKNKTTREPRIFKLENLLKNGNGLNDKVKRIKPVVGVTLWNGFDNNYWDLTEICNYNENYYWDNDEKGFKIKRKQNITKKGIIIYVEDKKYEI